MLVGIAAVDVALGAPRRCPAAGPMVGRGAVATGLIVALVDVALVGVTLVGVALATPVPRGGSATLGTAAVAVELVAIAELVALVALVAGGSVLEAARASVALGADRCVSTGLDRPAIRTRMAAPTTKAAVTATIRAIGSPPDFFDSTGSL